jgi:hypothetical protein
VADAEARDALTEAIDSAAQNALSQSSDSVYRAQDRPAIAEARLKFEKVMDRAKLAFERRVAEEAAAAVAAQDINLEDWSKFVTILFGLLSCLSPRLCEYYRSTFG